DTAPGNFTHEPALGGWVWTSFYPFQWDLDWSNPAVFREMLDVLLFWSNIGVDAFRLDSAPYLWKRRGSVSRNLPETHRLVAALRAGLDIAAPG
ncbi:alpha-amylase family glycosyl hydrolase, partial [Enterococcus faecium]